MIPPGSLLFGTTSGLAAVLSLAQLQWNFDGERTIVLDTPIVIQDRRYGNPELLGAGSSGAVFRLEPLPADNDDDRPIVALKVSWDSTGDIIRKECATLHELLGTPNVPRCIDVLPYTTTNNDDDINTKRSMMAMIPVVDHIVTSFDDLDDPDKAVTQIIETSVDMLRKHVYTVDVQWLLSKDNNNALLIDFTERSDNAGSLLAEVIAGIPQDLRPVALSALRHCMESEGVEKGQEQDDFQHNLSLFSALLDGD